MFLSVPYIIWRVLKILNINYLQICLVTSLQWKVHVHATKEPRSHFSDFPMQQQKRSHFSDILMPKKKKGSTSMIFPCNKKQGFTLMTFPCNKKQGCTLMTFPWNKKQGYTLMTFPCNKKTRFHFNDIPMHYCVHNTLMEQCYLWWFIVWFINFTVLAFGQCFSIRGRRWQLWTNLKTSFH